MSPLIYGIVVFGGTSKKMLKSLQVLQNYVARIYTNLPIMGTHIRDLLDQAKLLSVHQLSVYHSLMQYWKIKKNQIPEYLHTRIRNIETEIEPNQRPRRIVAIQNIELQNTFNLKIMGDSFICRTKMYWCQMPEDSKSTNKTLYCAKRNINKWVKENVPILPDAGVFDVH